MHKGLFADIVVATRLSGSQDPHTSCSKNVVSNALSSAHPALCSSANI